MYGRAAFGTAAFGSGGDSGIRLDLSSSAVATTLLENEAYQVLVSSAIIEGAAVADVLANLISRINARGSLDVLATLRSDAASSGSFADAIHAAWQLLLEETGEAAGDAEGVTRKLVAIAETLAALDQLDGRNTAYAAAAVAGALEGRYTPGWAASAEEQAEVADAAQGILRAMLDLGASLSVEDGAQGSLKLSVLAEGSAAVADSAAATLKTFADLESSAVIYCSLRIGSTDYHGWVLNTQLKAVTEFRETPFDSITPKPFKGKTYAANEDGIFEIGGDTDDGAPINAWITPFLTDFGTQKFKRASDIWVGIDAKGRMWVKVLTRDPRSGERKADFYPVKQRQVTGPANGRVVVGKGLKSTYWGLTLQNFDPEHPELSGGDFDLDFIDWLQLIQDRSQ